MSIEPRYKEKIIRILSALFPDTRIILYGSRARETQRLFSDIDLALDAGKEISRHDIQEAISMLQESNVPYKIDIVDLWAVRDEMRKAIQKEGIVWKT